MLQQKIVIPTGNESMAKPEARHCVAVVVDPAFGDRLLGLAARVHVWVIGTPENKATAQRVWRDGGGVHSLERGVTTFSATQTDPPDEVVASVLGTIDLHHGEYSHAPPLSVLEVFGADPTPALVSVLAEYGFSKVVPESGGFKAWRSIESAG